MPYPLLNIPEFSGLFLQFRRHDVMIHLHGYLAEGEFPFVDVCHTAASMLSLQVPEGLRFIYPFPVSSQACIEGLRDPLQGPCDNLVATLGEHIPGGCSEIQFQDHMQELVEQAYYVRQFAPSRLVLIGDAVPPDDVLENWLGQLLQSS